jgi:hypothetical protein
MMRGFSEFVQKGGASAAGFQVEMQQNQFGKKGT